MHTGARSRSTRLTAAIVCALVAGHVAAREQLVTISLRVSSQGLDLSQTADVQTFYARLREAAHQVCNHPDRVDLAPNRDPHGCYEQALGNAVGSARLPMLTQLYLATHTLQQAAAHGIEVPSTVAAN